MSLINYPDVYVPQKRHTAGLDGAVTSDWHPVGRSQFYRTRESAIELIQNYKRESLPELQAITQFRVLKWEATDLEAVF